MSDTKEYQVFNDRPNGRIIFGVDGPVRLSAGETKTLKMSASQAEDEKAAGLLVEDADASYEDMTADDLESLATERGVMPSEGSGKDGRVLKADIIAALESENG